MTVTFTMVFSILKTYFWMQLSELRWVHATCSTWTTNALVWRTSQLKIWHI